jgi:glyoxylase-like metal-dependent hydrolase (beta-lactamase superfamily II)
VALHRRDVLAWREVHLGREPDIEMEEGGIFEVADVALEVLHTPGHSPGSVSLYCEGLGVVFSGDALTADGPAPHAGEYPDFPGQLSAIGQELLTLPEETRVLPGHGEEITVETAGRRFDAWVAAGPADGRAGTG